MRESKFQVVDAASSSARWAVMQYFDELARRFPQGFDGQAAIAESSNAFSPPQGLFVLARPIDSPVACGAIQFLDDDRGEIKRMWVAPPSRGQGLASELLTYLEDEIRDSGRTLAVLDTNDVLTAAIALYRRNGYQQIQRYNDNPYATSWFSKSLFKREL